VEDFHSCLRSEWPRIRQELVEGRYVPQPVLRVEIPKPGGSQRKLDVLMSRLYRRVGDAILLRLIHRYWTGCVELSLLKRTAGYGTGPSVVWEVEERKLLSYLIQRPRCKVTSPQVRKGWVGWLSLYSASISIVWLVPTASSGLSL
jgi:hypothetical protein